MRDRRIRRVVLAIQNLLATQPFFGSLSLRLPIVPCADTPTMACDGERLYANLEWVEQAQAADIQATISDLVMGCVLKHHTRRGGRDYGIWQEAHGEVVRPILRDAGITQEPGGLDMSIEDAYEKLKKERPDKDSQQPHSDPAGMPEAGGGQGQCQGDGNRPDGGANARGSGEMLDSPSPDERQEIEQQWDEAGRQAAAHAKNQGHSPASIEELLRRLHSRQIDWADVLKEFLTAAAKADYSWSRPDRRFAGQGIHLPGLHSEAMAPVAFCIDTSASLDSEALSPALVGDRRGLRGVSIRRVWRSSSAMRMCRISMSTIRRISRTR